MTKDVRQFTEMLLTLILVMFSYLAGYVIAGLVAMIPSGWRLFFIPVNPLSFVILIIIIIMFWKLIPSLKHSRNTLIIEVAMISVYTLIIYLIAVDTPKSVNFDVQILSILTLFVYVTAILPFTVKQRLIHFLEKNARRDSIFFAASIMWLSPFLAEILLLLSWFIQGNLWNRLSYMVLGGSGTNDVLFFYGFWVFISIDFFHFLTRIKKRTEKHETQEKCHKSHEPQTFQRGI
jgi:MFS family permease